MLKENRVYEMPIDPPEPDIKPIKPSKDKDDQGK